MRIQIKSEKENLNLVLPTGLIFSKGVIWVANHTGRKYAADALEHIPPETLEAMISELRRVKKKYGSWELVDIESSDGQMVKISL